MNNQSTYPLRLPHSVKTEVERRAKQEGTSINQFVATAVAEKVSALRTESYIAERAARADVPKALRILKRAGVGSRPVKGDEIFRSKRK